MKIDETLKKQTGKKKVSRGKYTITAVIIICVIAVYAYSVATWKSKAPESQKESENIIRSATQRFNPGITDNNFKNITRLTIGESLISSVSVITELADIKPLEEFTNLEVLHIRHIIYPKKNIPKWISIAAKLGILDIDKYYALDLSPLEKLYNLRVLAFNQTSVKNIKPISGLVNLQHLDINGTAVSDLTPIKNLKNLEYLNISRTKVTSLEPIRGLTNLQTLYTYQTPVSDIDPLKELKNLKNLYLGPIEDSNLEPIRGLTNLMYLDLSGPEIDLEVIADLENLVWLSLSKTNVSNLEPIKKLRHLDTLLIGNCHDITDQQIEDLQKALPNLEIQR